MRITLASQSPRRQELLKALGWELDIVIPEVDETISEDWTEVLRIPEMLAERKAEAVYNKIPNSPQVIIAADTLVMCDGTILGKPEDEEEARVMLQSLSNKTHQVVTGVCMKNNQRTVVFSSVTNVTFKQLKNSDIEYYISTGAPMDKAGAYGIQDWIGLIGIEKIEGDYYNVMGLPVEKIYDKINEFL